MNIKRVADSVVHSMTAANPLSVNRRMAAELARIARELVSSNSVPDASVKEVVKLMRTVRLPFGFELEGDVRVTPQGNPTYAVTGEYASLETATNLTIRAFDGALLFWYGWGDPSTRVEAPYDFSKYDSASFKALFKKVIAEGVKRMKAKGAGAARIWPFVKAYNNKTPPVFDSQWKPLEKGRYFGTRGDNLELKYELDREVGKRELPEFARTRYGGSPRLTFRILESQGQAEVSVDMNDGGFSMSRGRVNISSGDESEILKTMDGLAKKLLQQMKEKYGKLNLRAMTEEIAKRHIRWFSFDGEENGMLTWSSRDSGDVGEGVAGVEDLRAARKFVDAVNKEVPGAKAQMEDVDEWVHASVRLP